jgi:hypothetical protein
MTASEKRQVIQEVKQVSDSIIRFSEKAQVEALLGCYSQSEDFRAISADGKMRNYDEFKTLGTAFYQSVTGQEISTVQETFSVLGSTLVIFTWTGQIDAFFKNGDIMKMPEYAVSCVFQKTNRTWKVIHSHESCLAPEIQKANQTR